MEWFTTNEAAEALKITTTRVRQLVQKHKSNKELVKSTKKKTRTTYIVSDKFIEVCQTNRTTFTDKFKNDDDVLKLPNGRIVASFSEDEYNHLDKVIFEEHPKILAEYQKVKKELEEIEVRFKDHIADLRNERNYLRKSLDNQQEQFSKLLQAVQQRNLIEATEKGIKPNEND